MRINGLLCLKKGVVPALALLFLLAYQNCSPQNFSFEPYSQGPGGQCVPLSSPSLQPVEKFRWDHANSTMPDYRQVMSTPMVADLDGDRVPEIVFSSYHSSGAYNGRSVLRVLSGSTGAEKFSVTDPNIAPKGDSSPLLIDIDGDGFGEIIYIHFEGAKLIALNHDGTLRWEVVLPNSLNDCIGGPAAGDFNGDGRAEILIENVLITETSASSATATVVGPYWPSSCTSFAISVDPSEPSTLHIVTAAGVFRSDGTPILSLPLEVPANIIGSYRGRRLAAADLRQELPGLELVFTEEGRLKAYNILSGVSLFDVPIAADVNRFGGLSGDGGPPNISDFDGDGNPDIGAAGAVFYGAYDRYGNVIWQTETNDYSSQITGSSVFDFNGDGRAEAIYADEGYLKIHRGHSGQAYFTAMNPSATHLEYPIVVDADGDGTSELIVSMNNASLAPWATPEEAEAIMSVGSGIRAFKSRGNGWVRTRPIWNQYAYFVSNVTDDLRAVSSTPVEPGRAQRIFRQNTLNQFRNGCQNP